MWPARQDWISRTVAVGVCRTISHILIQVHEWPCRTAWRPVRGWEWLVQLSSPKLIKVKMRPDNLCLRLTHLRQGVGWLHLCIYVACSLSLQEGCKRREGNCTENTCGDRLWAMNSLVEISLNYKRELLLSFLLTFCSCPIKIWIYTVFVCSVCNVDF